MTKMEINKHQERKGIPLYTGALVYFPDALKEVARVSRVANEQHSPGEPVHWDKSKSKDEADALMRHLADHAKGELYDDDGLLHIGKVAWRGLALLQRHFDQLSGTQGYEEVGNVIVTQLGINNTMTKSPITKEERKVNPWRFLWMLAFVISVVGLISYDWQLAGIIFLLVFSSEQI